jgi:hypothetical protein
MIKSKFKEWIKRYLPAEIVGTATAIGAATIGHIFYSNLIIVAYIAAVGEAIGFYSTVFIRSLLIENKKHGNEKSIFSFSNFFKIIIETVIEFGPAGILDGFFLRPFFMYLFSTLLTNFSLGILVGKIAGDFTFYVVVICSYELTKRIKTKQRKHTFYK